MEAVVIGNLGAFDKEDCVSGEENLPARHPPLTPAGPPALWGTMNPLKWALHWQIFAAMVLSVAATVIVKLTGGADAALGGSLLGLCAFLGQLFMNALKMIIVPLVGSSIIASMAALTAGRDFRRLGLKTLAYYVASGAVAVTIGLLAVNIIQPGNVSPEVVAHMQANAQGAEELIASKVTGKSSQDIWEVFLRMFPSNIIENAANNGALLGLITFSLLYGFFVSRLEEQWREPQRLFWEGVSRVMTGITDLILKFAPIGVFALVTPQLVALGWDLLAPLGKFTLTVGLALGLHVAALCAALACFKIKPWSHLKGMSEPLLTAFSTASSSGTLPLTLEAVEREAKVSPHGKLHAAARGDGQHGRHRALRVRGGDLHHADHRGDRPEL